MEHYAILRNPGHNQVFYENSAQLALAELESLSLSLTEVQLLEIAGLWYLAFSVENPLTQEALEKIARLSSTYGLFQREGELLRPIPLPNVQVFPQSLATILKYQGKTNEIFTRMLLNFALSQGNYAPKEVKLLDPVAGRGTTLFEGFSLGMNVYGTELQEKAVSDGFAHLKKFLEKGKYKHRKEERRFSGENKVFTAKKHSIFCENQEFQFISADSKYVNQLFSKNFFHIIVGDLPYGVQHGRTAGGKSRSPAQLLTSCARPWYDVLRKDGVLLLSYNTLVIPRDKIVEILESKGFVVEKEGVLANLSHKVDASILRDIVVAKKG
ncbi:MAG: hypothetical protein R3Y63_11100 [Eubacteriales bacterium]